MNEIHESDELSLIEQFVADTGLDIDLGALQNGMQALRALMRSGFNIGQLKAFKDNGLVVVPHKEWKFLEESFRITQQALNSEEPELKPPYCPGCCHNEFDIVEMNPRNLHTNLSVLVCAKCSTLCGVLG